MFSSNSIKLFSGLSFAAFVFSSCGWQQVKTATPAAFTAEAIKSEIPFSTKEPETFQAEFVVTSGGRETKTFFARSGDKQRYDYARGAKNQVTVLHSDANRSFLIYPAKKIYAENPASQVVAQTTGNFKDFLTNEWLNQKANAKFTSLGTENDLTKYRVILNDSGNAETIVFIDEKINLPVRQEFYSIEDRQKTLTFVFEMRNFEPRAEESLFEIPKNFRQVSLDNLKTTMRKDGFDEK